MADSPGDIRTWPTSPEDLADNHKCPGCFTRVTVPTCPVCGFVLTDPRALEVLALGRSILIAEKDRQRIIAEVRRAQEAAAMAAFAAAMVTPAVPAPPVQQEEPAPLQPSQIAHSTTPIAVPVASPPPAAAATPAVPPVRRPQLEPWQVARPPVQGPPPRAPRPPREPRPPRRRLSVPVLLLIVGVSLVGVAAVFFLVYAWFTWGIAVRALIIGAITIATIAIASLLRRRSLTATAEGIAVLGVILLALDAWAVRANDFFATAQVEPALYCGFAVLAVGLLCRVWAMLSKLRSPDVAAVLALPAGVGLLVGGATSLPAGQAVVAGLLGAAAGGLVHALPAPWSSARARADAVPERTTLAIIGIGALVVAAVIAAFVSFDDIALPLWSGAAIIVLGAAHAVLLRPGRDAEELPASRILTAVASSTAAAVATVLGWQLALRSDLPVYALLIGPVVAVAVPVLLDRVPSRIAVALPARITAAALGVLSLLATLSIWLAAAVGAIALGWTAWLTDAVTAPPDQVEGAAFAAIAGVLIALALFAAPTLGRPVLRNARLVVAAVVLLAGVSVIAIPALVVGVAALIAVAALLALRRPGLRVGSGVAAGLGALTAFASGTTTPWLWVIGIAVAVAVPIAAQLIVKPTGYAAGGLSFAPIGVATVAAFLAPGAIAAVAGSPAQPFTAFVLVQWVAVAAVLTAVVLRLESSSRTTLAVSGYALFLISLLPYASAAIGSSSGIGAFVEGSAAVLGEPGLGILRSAALLVLLAILALGRTRVAATPALAAAVLVPASASFLTFSVVETLGLADHDARAVATVGAAVAVVWVAALWSMRHTDAPALTRTLVDLGALAATLALAWDTPLDLRWVMLAVVATGFAGASVARGWAAPLSAAIAGVPSTRGAGVPLGRAPRRLLAWPAFALATGALWSGLSTAPGASSLTVEAYALPPAVGLLAFAALLVWLRRHAEAAVAITASFLLGLAAPALIGWSGSPVRGTVVAIIAAALCLLLTGTPAIRARVPAVAGASTALFALGLVTLQRAFEGPPAQVAWLVLLVGVAYGSAAGAVLALRGAPRRSWYALIVPPIAVAAATAAGVLWADRAPVLVVALVVLAGLHVAASAIGRDPLGVATRGTSIAAAAAFATAGFVGGAATIDGIPIVELVSLPVALTVLIGSALAQWRRRGSEHASPDAEHVVWVAGVVLAVVPSIIAPVEPLRVWLGVIIPLVAALVAVLVPLEAVRTLRTSSAVVLTAAAVVMGARTLAQATFESAEFAVWVAGVGAVLVAIALIWTTPAVPDAAGQESADTPFADAAPAEKPRTGSDTIGIATAVAATGAALLLAALVVVSDGGLVRSTVTTIIAAAAAVGGAALLRRRRWRGLGAVLAVGGFLGALVSISARLIIIFDTAGSSIEPDLWAAIALGITAAIGIMALRATVGTTVAPRVATIVGVAFAGALLFFTAVELLLLGASAGDEVRTVFTMSVLTVAGVAGMLWRSPLGLTPPIAAAVGAVVFGLTALVLYAVTPVELITVPAAVGLIALGARALRHHPQARTWPTLGPGLALLTMPSLLHDFFGGTDLWRIVALGVVAVGMVVVGAVWRLQAPLILGSVVLLAHGIAQLWPWISSAYVYVPWWLWLGIGGALLIYLAARYESSMRALRTSFTAVTSLR
jgi:hypothetical protein